LINKLTEPAPAMMMKKLAAIEFITVATSSVECGCLLSFLRLHALERSGHPRFHTLRAQGHAADILQEQGIECISFWP